MSYDPTTRTITLGDQSDFLADTGLHFVHTYKTLVSEPNAPATIVRDWRVLEEWLRCANRNLTPEDMKTISLAWKSYLAKGISPSLRIENEFKQFALTAKQEKWQTIKIPNEVEDVFDRMLASESEIQEKRKAELERVANAIKALCPKKMEEKTTTIGRIKTVKLTKSMKVFISCFMAWFVWVTVRTSGDFYLFEIYFGSWSNSSYWSNLFTPVVVIGAIGLALRWIRRE